MVPDEDSVDRQCLDNEAKILQLLRPNSNVIQVFDVYEDDGFQHIVMELCNGDNLFQRISTVAFSLFQFSRRGISWRGVAHRDIKPDNILFNDWKGLKLADFGSAEFVREGEPMSGLVGTPYYVAPEVVAGRFYNEKVDIWSAGVILYVMLAGFPPFYGDSAAEIFEAVLRGNLRFPPRLFHSVSPDAKDLLRRMICKDVSRRFSAEQVLSKACVDDKVVRRGEQQLLI
ncbi:hypothetical protein Leryth_024083 [Lithospermum erythrorhizon]|nr:hypothetical protein Leryth_024083 [Lithospermum erythrorhizon]